MKIKFAIIISILLTISLSSCGQEDTPYENENSRISAGKNTNSKNNTDNTSKSVHVLIAYFTLPENVGDSDIDAISRASVVIKDNEKMGSTEYIAKLVQKTIGGDLFRIETKDSYPMEHDMLLDRAAEEQECDIRPELSSHVENIAQYDIIILGFPNWWGDLPMPVYSFLEEYGFGNKTIIPFVTYNSSGFSNTLDTIIQLQPGADISDNILSLSREDVADGEEKVREWAEGLRVPQ